MKHTHVQGLENLLLPSYTSGPMTAVLDYARRFARSPDPILILGERGTGKTSLAHQIHTWSGRSGVFVAYALSATNDELFLDDLFGHVSGAFTGATHARGGLLEEANEGTLFLDEFATASRRIQRSLLGILEGRGYRAAGESRLRRVTTRFILATNADVERSQDLEDFRRDLLDRIGFLKLVVPPLRQRRREILPLFDFFVAEICASLGCAEPAVTPAAISLLLGADWPGNVRELRAAARYAVVNVDEGEPIDARHLPDSVLDPTGEGDSARSLLTAHALKAALLHTGGNVSEAARRLNVDRRTIQRHLKVYGGWTVLKVRNTGDAAAAGSDMSQASGPDQNGEVIEVE